MFYTILKKNSDLVPVDVISDSAGEEIRSLKEQGFEIVCEKIEAASSREAIQAFESKDTKPNNVFKKLIGLLKKHYIFLFCLLFIFIGVDMLDSSFWSYNTTDAQTIATNIKSGAKIIAGSVLIGTSIVALAISKLITSK